MPTQVGWLIENCVIYSRSTGVIDETLINHHADCLVEMLNNGESSNVHIIIDSLRLVKFRIDIVKLNQQTQRYLKHPRVVSNTDVTRNVKNQMLGNVVSDMAGVKWAHCQTLAQALQFIQKQDDTLPPLSIDLFDNFKALKAFD